MDPVASFTYETFRDRLGESFSLPAAGIDLVLVQAVDHAKGAAAREGGAFSLYFAGPPDTLLHQSTHEMTHAELGGFALFLVPNRRTADGFEYEAAFN